MSEYQVITGDCIEIMRGLPAGSVDCCVTSPPRLSSEEVPARRRARLQALGNGWVPQAAAFVLCAIRDVLTAASSSGVTNRGLEPVASTVARRAHTGERRRCW